MRPLSRLTLASILLLALLGAAAAQNVPPPPMAAQNAVQPGGQTIYVQSSTVYLKRELMAAMLQARPEFAASGLAMAPDAASADLVLDVTRPFLTFDWVYRLSLRGMEISSGVVKGWDAQEVAPQIAAEVARQLPTATRALSPAVPRSQFAAASPPSPPPGVAMTAAQAAEGKSVYVHSDTVYLKDEQLHAALAAMPAWQSAGLRLAADRASADLMVDVKRPFLTFDWNWTVRDTRSSALLASGKVTAADGPTAAMPLAQHIVDAIAVPAPAYAAASPFAAQLAPALAATVSGRSWNVRRMAPSGLSDTTLTVTPTLVTISGASGVFHVPAASILDVRYSTSLYDPSVEVYRSWDKAAEGVNQIGEYSPDGGLAAGAVLLGISPLYLGSGLLAGLDRANLGYVHLAWEENGSLRRMSFQAADRQQADELFSALLLAQQQSRAPKAD